MTPVYVDDAATLSSRCDKGDSAAPAGGMPLATVPKIGGNADRKTSCFDLSNHRGLPEDI